MTQKIKDVDWKAIAHALAQRVNFAIQHLRAPSGTAGMMDMKTGKFTPWREYMAEAMEQMPGVEIDREVMALLDLPPSKKRKALSDLKKKRMGQEKP